MEEDDMPPLEDMSTLVDRVKEKQKSKNTSLKSTNGQSKIKSGDTQLSEKKNAKKNSNVGYGGLKKGFLFGNPSATKAKSSKAVTKTVSASPSVDYELKAKVNSNNLVFDEVQEAINENKGFPLGSEWVTDDLLKKVEGNESLVKKLADPKFSKALERMQQDPKAAKEYYRNDEEVQEFFMEFYKILGHHFTSLGEQTNSSTTASAAAPKSKDEIRFEKILERPEIKQILAKPKIQELFTALRSNPEEGQYLFRSSSADVKADVEKLTEMGLLSFEQRPNKTT